MVVKELIKKNKNKFIGSHNYESSIYFITNVYFLLLKLFFSSVESRNHLILITSKIKIIFKVQRTNQYEICENKYTIFS